jgi:mannose-6-phosphate isomerase-like protein (cupin superfamily)
MVRSFGDCPQADGPATLRGVVGEEEVLRDSYELLQSDKDYGLTLGYTIVYPNCTTRGHSHDELEEVYFFTAGEGEMVLDDKRVAVKPGSAIRIPFGAFHQVRNVGIEPLTYCWVTSKRRAG